MERRETRRGIRRIRGTFFRESPPCPLKELEKWFVGEDIILPFFIYKENLHPRRQGGAARGRDKKVRREDFLAAEIFFSFY